MKKFLIVLTTIIVVLLMLLIQKNVLEKIPLFGICPNIGTVLVCAIAVVSGAYVGGAIGFFYGLALDVAYGRMVGMNLLAYLIIGIICGLLNYKISKDSKISLAVFVFASTILLELITAFFMVLFYKVDISLTHLLKIISIESIYNLFLSFVFYHSLTALGEQINRTKKSYYVLN